MNPFQIEDEGPFADPMSDAYYEREERGPFVLRTHHEHAAICALESAARRRRLVGHAMRREDYQLAWELSSAEQRGNALRWRCDDAAAMLCG